jgi:spore maturation protein SpmB
MASGCLNYLTEGIGWLVASLGVNTDFSEALPVAFLKPLSGQSARAMMAALSTEAGKTGIDTFTTQLAAVLRGCTETTFYILALYFGSVNIRKTRYALTAGLIADAAGIVAAIFVAYLFFH